MERFSHLLSPITIGNVHFGSRIFSAPMSGADITTNCCIGPANITKAIYEGYHAALDIE